MRSTILAGPAGTLTKPKGDFPIARPYGGRPLPSAQDFYREHGNLGAPGAYAAELRALPRDLKELTRVVQGALIHRDVAPFLYGLKFSAEARDAANLRALPAVLSRIATQNKHPIAEARAPSERMPCVCWHFSTLLAAMLREQGVPARARCGFGAYFNRGRYEDHWVAEYWNEGQSRWVLVDAQLDPVQVSAFKPDFDPLDVPRDRFILAGDAWTMCRRGTCNPELFGLSFLNEQGFWWIAANLMRDLAALNRVDMLPWDVWGTMPEPSSTITDQQATLLDEIAALTLAGDVALEKLVAIYQDPRLAVPATVFNADRKKTEPVA